MMLPAHTVQAPGEECGSMMQAAELAVALSQGAELPETTNMFSPTLVRRHSVSNFSPRG